MDIDARELDKKELFAGLKELLSLNRECKEISIEILTGTLTEANKVKGFAVMSGCRATIAKEGDHYKVHLRGTPCCT